MAEQDAVCRPEERYGVGLRRDKNDLLLVPEDLAAARHGLDAVLAEERSWRELSVPAMSLIVFRHEVLMEFSRESLEFIAQAKREKAP